MIAIPKWIARKAKQDAEDYSVKSQSPREIARDNEKMLKRRGYIKNNGKWELQKDLPKDPKVTVNPDWPGFGETYEYHLTSDWPYGPNACRDREKLEGQLIGRLMSKRALFEAKRSGNDPLHYVIEVSVNDRTNPDEIKDVALDALTRFVDTAVPEDLTPITEEQLAKMQVEKQLSLPDTVVFRVIS